MPNQLRSILTQKTLQRITLIFFPELGITEHIEGDECKFAIWTGRAPMIFDYRIVLRANSLETKQSWVKKLRQVLQETYFSSSTLNNLMKSPGKATSSGSNNNNNNNNTNKNAGQRLSKEGGDEHNLCEADQDINSLASFGSGNTTDSEKVSDEMYFFLFFSKRELIKYWCYEKEMTHL